MTVQPNRQFFILIFTWILIDLKINLKESTLTISKNIWDFVLNVQLWKNY